MSTAQHEHEGQSQAAAAGQATAAGNDAALYVPRPGIEVPCDANSGSEPCWNTITNPTEKYLRAAEEHRRQAADHRAASAALRGAEERDCVGISARNRDMSPFDHVEDIASVEPLIELAGDAESNSHLTVGAIVTFRAVPGMTAEWVQREVDCHLARNASLGYIVPEMPNCPLVPKGVQARVTSSGNGFAVAIRSDDRSTASEILARAQRLRSAHVN